MGRSNGLSSGLTPFETQVLDLWDAGQSIERIIAALGRPRAVRQVIWNFVDDDARLRALAGLLEANARYLAALRAAGMASAASLPDEDAAAAAPARIIAA